MKRRRYTYGVRPANRDADGERFWIVRTVEGPNAHLAPEPEQFIEPLREDQARDLLESLQEELEQEQTTAH